METFEIKGEGRIEVGKIADDLQVERRRIYDILNIFQSLNVIEKEKKDVYVWRGLTHAYNVIAAIKDGKY